MSNGDSGMPRPAKVEVGQRWMLPDVDKEPHAVVRITGDFAWFDDGESGIVLNMLEGLGGWRYLGGPETSGGGVAVGQRIGWSDGEFVITAVDAARVGCQVETLVTKATKRYSVGHREYSWRIDSILAYLADGTMVLLPSTPAPPGLGGPVTNVVVDASLQPKKRPRTLREVMETRYPDRCQWFTYSTPGGVGKQCEMTHSGLRSPYCEAHVFEAMEARRVAAAPSKPTPPSTGPLPPSRTRRVEPQGWAMSPVVTLKIPDGVDVSDGYHTFAELYEHRIALFIALCRELYSRGLRPTGYVWRSKLHSDGTSFDGWFIMGIGREPGKQITYHLPMSKWADTDWLGTEFERPPPEFDGHKSVDVLNRLGKL